LLHFADRYDDKISWPGSILIHIDSLQSINVALTTTLISHFWLLIWACCACAWLVKNHTSWSGEGKEGVRDIVGLSGSWLAGTGWTWGRPVGV